MGPGEGRLTQTLVLAALTVSMAPAALRWLRIAQREHYLAGAVTRFALRWWTHSPGATATGLAALALTVVSGWWVVAGLGVAMAVAVGPPGLSVRGRTSPLAWTPRMRRLAGGVVVVAGAGVAAGWVFAPVVTAVTAVALPVLVDLSLAVTGPLERRLGRPWLERASARLRDSGAAVVAITGSYGKTGTKGYVAHLLGGIRRTVSSPASFNNRMGLARAVNEHLVDGVEVFVAEMGTYGPGEISDLCRWFPPRVSVITAIGPVHLERFGDQDRIVAAKAEILTEGAVAVLNVDDPRLAALADTRSGRVVRVGTGMGLDVSVVGGRVVVMGNDVGPAPVTVHPGNLACAVGVVVALGIDATTVAPRLSGLTEPEYRRTVTEGAGGALIVDDTFNANPAGARAALAVLENLDVAGRRVVVTPGMVELGHRQFAENRDMAAHATRTADLLVIVGSTNRGALREGAPSGKSMEVPDRETAVAWVRSNLGPGDAVLYENDLPDHYP